MQEEYLKERLPINFLCSGGDTMIKRSVLFLLIALMVLSAGSFAQKKKVQKKGMSLPMKLLHGKTNREIFQLYGQPISTAQSGATLIWQYRIGDKESTKKYNVEIHFNSSLVAETVIFTPEIDKLLLSNVVPKEILSKKKPDIHEVGNTTIYVDQKTKMASNAITIFKFIVKEKAQTKTKQASKSPAPTEAVEETPEEPTEEDIKEYCIQVKVQVPKKHIQRKFNVDKGYIYEIDKSQWKNFILQEYKECIYTK